MDDIPERLTPQEAEALAVPLNAEIRVHTDYLHLLRWQLAVLAIRIRDNVDYGDKTEEVKAYAEMVKLSWSTLAAYMAVVNKLSFNIVLFDRWLQTGGYKTQEHIYRLSRIKEDPNILGPEGMNELLLRDTERAVESIDRMQESDEKTSISVVLSESARAALEKSGDGIAGDPELVVVEITNTETGEVTERAVEKVFMDPPDEFWEMVRQCYCISCGAPGPSDPHHVEQGGWALKGSDWTIIPLCRTCHTLAEDNPPKRFRELTGLDQGHAVARILHIWVTKGLDLSIPL